VLGERHRGGKWRGAGVLWRQWDRLVERQGRQWERLWKEHPLQDGINRPAWGPRGRWARAAARHSGFCSGLVLKLRLEGSHRRVGVGDLRAQQLHLVVMLTLLGRSFGVRVVPGTLAVGHCRERCLLGCESVFQLLDGPVFRLQSCLPVALGHTCIALQRSAFVGRWRSRVLQVGVRALCQEQESGEYRLAPPVCVCSCPFEVDAVEDDGLIMQEGCMHRRRDTSQWPALHGSSTRCTQHA
jgi:hypothetical protein